MEDKKRKKEEKRKRETSQKVVEQKNKVPELTKPPSAQSPATPSSASPSPGPVPSATSSIATPPAGTPPQGGNNAKRPAVANGQPSPSTQAPQRYMPREVPPRFRCQQDHKVLLKRGQPPLSSMLLGGGNSGGDSPSATVAAASDSNLGSAGPAAPSLPYTSSSSIAASSTTTSNYANSMWGVSSGSQPLSQGREKVIVDGSDLEEWPSIAAGDGARAGDAAVPGGADGSVLPNCSASWGERHLQQQAKVVAGGTEGGKSVNSGSSSPPSSSCLNNECMQPTSSVWGSQGVKGGNAVAAVSLPPLSKASSLPGTECSVGVSCGIPGANFNPNANPSAWPALVQDGAGAAATEGGPSPLQSSTSLSANNSVSVNQVSHQHQPNQMQYRDMEPSSREWGGAALDPGAGPKNTEVTEGGDADCGTGGRDNTSASSSSSTSSSAWRAQPFSANSKTGASRTDAWEGGAGGSSVSTEGGSSWGFSGQDDRGGPVSGSTWGTGSGCQMSGVSQGAWGGEVGEWGNSGGVSNPGGGNGAGSSSNSSCSSGGSVGNPSASSSTPSTMTRAWDNQKGAVEGVAGESSEWGGQGSRGGGTSSSSGGGNSKSGNQHQGHHRTHQPPNAEVALQSLLSRTDLDPRVLSNSGWGQTQIRQNVAWDLDGGEGISTRSSAVMSASSHAAPYSGSTGTSTTAPSSLSLRPCAPQSANLNLNSNSILGAPSVSPGEGWDNSSSSSSSSSLPNRGPQPPCSSVQNPAGSQSGAGAGHAAAGQGKPSGGWGEASPSESQGKGWGVEGQEWRDHKTGSGTSGWGDFRQQGTPAGVGGDWGNSQEEKGTGGWKEMGRGDGGNWGQRSGSEWGERESKASSGGWGDAKESEGTGGDSEVGTWGSWDEGAPRKAWGGGGGTETKGGGDPGSKPHPAWGGNVHPSQMPNSQSASLKGQAQQQQQSQPQQSQSQSLDAGAMQGGWGKQGGPSAQSQSSGWTSGPIPQTTSGPGNSSEPSGWEEPSPQSISRKKEIDDGTSAWGDPNNYNYVNYWDKNNAPSAQTQPMPSQQQGPAPPGRMITGPGNRDVNLKPSSNKGPAMAPSGWGRSSSPSSPCVDNGTAAWGKPTETPSGWGEPEDTGNASGWGNPSPNPIKSGSKSMQEGWGEREGSVSASRHSSWEEEDEGGVMWSSTGSQGSSSSYTSGGWGGKKANKGPIKSGDSWMNPMTRQFSNMGLLGEDPSGRQLDLAPGPPQDKKLDAEKRMGLNDYNGEMRKGGRGGPGGVVFRPPGSKEVGPGESGPYYDKQTLPFTNQDGCLGEEGLCSPYSPPPVFKPSPLYNHPNPPRQQMGGHMFGGGGGGMAQPRHQPGVPPINPAVRAQVPPQFLSPQVPGSMLKQMPPPSGGVGGVGAGVFPPQLSPQHILSSIYQPHVQFQLACQLLLQQQQQQPQQQQQLLQNQRKFPQNVRPQADPQQLARIMAVLQQRQQQQQVGSIGVSSKLSPSHLGSGGPKLPMPDTLSHPGLGGSVADLHQKSPSVYSGFGSGVNLSGLELGSMVAGPGGLKEGGGQQSRFKWMMEGHSPSPSSPDNALHKNGPIAAPLKRGGSPYSQYEMLGVEGLGVPVQGSSDSWQRSPGNKMGSKTGTSSWPPEFQPGVPWKGIQTSVDPESDPYMTPGSMLSSSAVSSLNDTEHQLLRDNTESNPSLNTLLPSPGAWPYSASDSPLNNAHNPAKYSEYKPSWPPEPIGHNKPWKTNRNTAQMPRPPPGLTSQKQPSVSPWAGGAPRLGRGWGGSGGSQESRYGPGSAWSDVGASRGSCWLVLSNLTPQIDGSTLRTICMQHGPLLTFHLGLTQGSALIRYSTRQEAAKAQSALHMCVLGNTTILAEFVSEEEVARYFAHSQAGGGGGGGSAGGGGGAAGAIIAGPAGTTGSSGAGAVGAGSVGSIPGGERERGGGVSSIAGSSNNGGGGGSGSGWQGLDGTGGSPDTVSSAQGPGLSIFAQWSNGAGTGAVEAGRQGLWGGMSTGHPGNGGGGSSSSLWASPALEDRHQMGSPAALLPGDLLGGGSDSI